MFQQIKSNNNNFFLNIFHFSTFLTRQIMRNEKRWPDEASKRMETFTEIWKCIYKKKFFRWPIQSCLYVIYNLRDNCVSHTKKVELMTRGAKMN